jgi:hypothetical protein
MCKLENKKKELSDLYLIWQISGKIKVMISWPNSVEKFYRATHLLKRINFIWEITLKSSEKKYCGY